MCSEAWDPPRQLKGVALPEGFNNTAVTTDGVGLCVQLYKHFQMGCRDLGMAVPKTMHKSSSYSQYLSAGHAMRFLGTALCSRGHCITCLFFTAIPLHLVSVVLTAIPTPSTFVENVSIYLLVCFVWLMYFG